MQKADKKEIKKRAQKLIIADLLSRVQGKDKRDLKKLLNISMICFKHSLLYKTKCEKCIAEKAEKEIQKGKTLAKWIKNGKCRNHPTRKSQQETFFCKDCLTKWLKERSKGIFKTIRYFTQLKKLAMEQDWKCKYTGQLLIPNFNMSIDHKIPKSRGGKDEIENLQWITTRVNVMKNDLLEQDFIDLCFAITTTNICKDDFSEISELSNQIKNLNESKGV